MRPWLAAFTLATISGCGGSAGPGARTPEDAFARWKDACLKRDAARLYELMPPSQRRQDETTWEKIRADIRAGNPPRMAMAYRNHLGVETDADVAALPYRDVFLKNAARILERQAAGGKELVAGPDWTLTRTQTHGDLATFTIQRAQGELNLQASKDDGGWYVRSPHRLLSP